MFYDIEVCMGKLENFLIYVCRSYKSVQSM